MSTKDDAFYLPLPMPPSSPIAAAAHHRRCRRAAFSGRLVAKASAALLER
jgi:hypothetical protein